MQNMLELKKMQTGYFQDWRERTTFQYYETLKVRLKMCWRKESAVQLKITLYAISVFLNNRKISTDRPSDWGYEFVWKFGL